MNNMLTVEEVKHFLELEQAELEKLLKQGRLRAYKIGGTYLRFRKDEVLNLRFDVLPQKVKTQTKRPVFNRVIEFWRFNNFYIITILLVIALALIVARA